MKKIVKLYKDYMYHRRAVWAGDTLRMHSNQQLKDIGITRNDINQMAHAKCPWCARWQK